MKLHSSHLGPFNLSRVSGKMRKIFLSSGFQGEKDKETRTGNWAGTNFRRSSQIASRLKMPIPDFSLVVFPCVRNKRRIAISPAKIPARNSASRPLKSFFSFLLRQIWRPERGANYRNLIKNEPHGSARSRHVSPLARGQPFQEICEEV